VIHGNTSARILLMFPRCFAKQDCAGATFVE
jgi:hypothetical protein